MKRTSLLLLTGIASAILLGALIIPDNSLESSTYEPRHGFMQGEASLAGEQEELYKRRRSDHITGLFDKEQWLDARDAMRRFDQENNRAASVSWVELGPDNIGGRTRAILIDQADETHIFAGSVSGGLFESFDAGNTWEKVQGFVDNLAVSTMAQSSADPNHILVGTAHKRDFFIGNGVYESFDGGVNWSSITQTATYSEINEIIYSAAAGKFFITSSQGLKTYDLSNGIQPASSPLNGSIECEGMASSPDGSVIVVGQNSIGVNTFVSTDAGQTWTDVASSAPGDIPSAGVSRMEYAVSHEPDASTGKYFIYGSAAQNGGTQFYGQYASNSNGESGTWGTTAVPSSLFDPFAVGNGGQGNYNNVISVFPGNPAKALLGGIDLYEWRIDQGSNPVFGQWEQKSLSAAGFSSPVYVHADNHEMKWDSQGNLYGGNDGGVYRSPAGSAVGDVFFASNKGYNVTQFYGIGYSSEGAVMGGTQDNGTLYNNFTGNTFMEFQTVRGGDGFDCDVSFLFPNVIFTSIYFGGITRSDDLGFTNNDFFSGTIQSCGSPGALSGGLGSFYTVGRLWETANDTNSTDSIIFLATSSMGVGDTAWATGNSQQNPVFTILQNPITVVDTIFPSGTVVVGTDTLNFFLNPVTLDTIVKNYDLFLVDVPLDTIKIQDKVQSWYATGFNHGTQSCDGVWFTRDALRFSHDPFWWHFDIDATGAAGNPTAIEFSADGNHCFVGTDAGDVVRISGLAALYGNNTDPGYAAGDADLLPAGVTMTRIYNGNQIEGIAVDPQDPEHVVLAIGGFGTSNVEESITAASTTGSGSFSSIMGDLPTGFPMYDAVIDRNDPNLIFVGTEFGLYATDDGGNTWTNNSTDFGNVPVYAVRQNWRTWDEGNKRPGELYVGTHGRGIWASGTYLSAPDPIQKPAPAALLSEIKLYPNPLMDQGTLAFDLEERADVNITVYSLSGRQVRQINLGTIPSGTHNIQVSAEGLSVGTYLVDLRAGQSRKTLKFIVGR